MKDVLAATPRSASTVDPMRQNGARPAEGDLPFGELLDASLEALAGALPETIGETLSETVSGLPLDNAGEPRSASEWSAEQSPDPSTIIAQILVPALPDTPPVRSAPTIAPDAQPAAGVEDPLLSRQPPTTGPKLSTPANEQITTATPMPPVRAEQPDPVIRESRTSPAHIPEARHTEFGGAMQEAKLTKELAPRPEVPPATQHRSIELASRAVAGSLLTRNEPERRHSSAEVLPASAPGPSAPATSAMQYTSDLPAVQRLEIIPQQIGTSAWDDALANRVSWMATHDIQSAEIRLNPPDLGPVSITLSLSGESDSVANVQFSAAHPATREAIELALPRLRDMLESSGISLGETGVSAGGEDRQQTRQTPDQTTPRRMHGETLISVTPPVRPQRGNGMVDTFA
jgi:flagellar hook-length control protein FliK